MIVRYNDEKQIYRFCAGLVYNMMNKTGIKLSDKEFNNLCQSEEYRKKAIFLLMQKDLADRIYEDTGEIGDYEHCVIESESVMEIVPEELMPNIEEWIDGKPLSDIKLHGVSINDVINMYKNKKVITKTMAIICLAAWQSQNFIDNHFCELYYLSN